MIEHVIRYAMIFGAIAPGFLLSTLIGDHMLSGMPKSDAVVMSLGYLAPNSWLFLLGLFALEAWKNKWLTRSR